MAVPVSSADAESLGRRRFITTAPAVFLGSSGLLACSPATGPESPEAVAAQIRRLSLPPGAPGVALGPQGLQELVRFATLAPSSHNTQCWKFVQEGMGIKVLPDLARRCPAVDPDDHHLFVSLGCAVENMAHAALAQGLQADARFGAESGAVHVALSPTPARSTALSQAITLRQCTRGDYDGKPLSNEELNLLESAGTSQTVRVLMLTERTALERVLDHVVQGNTAQMADPAFVKELKAWIRFNGGDAVRTGDGLFTVASGNPAIPAWLGERAFGWFFTAQGENDKYARQVRNSAGIAVFVGAAASPAHWVDVGRAYERFALQATALGIRNAFLNQPVEVAAVRAPFAALLGLAGQRPDLVVRFGRGAVLPASLRRPVTSVLL